MKKILTTTSSLVMGLALAGAANADTIGFLTKAQVGPTGSTWDTSIATNLACDMLQEVVDLSLSQNVAGAVNCAPINNVIEVAACHKGGTRDYVSCATYDATTNAIAGCSDTTGSGSTISFSAFFATSAGGVMQTRALADAGAGTCDDTNILTLTYTTD